MDTYTDKTQENKSLAMAHSLTSRQDKDVSVFQFVDNRSESKIQKNLFEGNTIQRVQKNLTNTSLKTNLVVQRILNTDNVAAKAGKFLAAHEAERQLIFKANKLLERFSEHADAENFHALDGQFSAIRDQISEETNSQAALIQEYIDTEDEAVRKTFMDTVLKKDSGELTPLFNKLINQTELGEDVDAKYKHRFLSYVLQGMKFSSGEGRFRELMELLGDKKVKVSSLPLGPSAGLADTDQNPDAEKTNVRDADADKELLEAHEGNLSEFVKAKFGGNGPDARTPNPNIGNVGNVAVNMERSQSVFPIYYGHTASKDVQAFTSPMFTANHHELGHVVNKLKGKAGRLADKYKAGENNDGRLSELTDEEEVHNISIDRYSDKAMSEDLGLPERIAHGAFGGLDAGSPDNLNGKYISDDLTKWDHLTYGLTPGRKRALELIKKIADGNWDTYTSYGNKPSGVEAIAKLVASIKNMGLGMKKQLEQIKKSAHDSFVKKSKNREFITKKFYEILKAMDVDTQDGLSTLEDQLEVIEEMGSF